MTHADSPSEARDGFTAAADVGTTPLVEVTAWLRARGARLVDFDELKYGAPMEGFGVGGVLGTSWRVWKRNLLPFTLIALAIYAPDVALRATVTDPNLQLALLPFSILLNTLLAASLTYGVVMELHGTRPSLRTCIVNGVGQLGPVIGVVFLTTLGIGLGLVIIVPGILLMLTWYVVVPVAIVERLGVMASMQRSRELTLGYKGKLFLVLVVTLVPTIGLPYLFEEMFTGVALAVVSIVSSAMVGSLLAVVTAVAYTALRHVKEGTRLPEIASAFARFKKL